MESQIGRIVKGNFIGKKLYGKLLQYNKLKIRFSKILRIER